MKLCVHQVFALFLTAGLGLGLLGCPAIIDSAIETVSDTATVADGGTLYVTNVNGAVSVTGADTDVVSVEARKRVDVYRTWGSTKDPEEFLADLEVRITEEDGDVTVETVVPSSLFVAGVVSNVQYTITVPHDTNLVIENTNGSIAVDDVQASVVIENVNGAVETEDTTGALDVSVTNGNADIEHEAALAAEESITVDVENGAIEVALPEDSAFDIQAETTVGGIDDGGFGFTIEPRNVTGRIVNDTVNGGGAQLDLDVEVGSIELTGL